MGFDPDPDLKVLGPVRSEVQQLMNEAAMGPIDHVRTTLKMVRQNPATSLLVQFTSVLPMTVVNLLIAMKAFSSVTEPFQQLLAQGGLVGDTFQAPNPALAFLLCLIVFALKINLIRSVFYTVGTLHHGKIVTIADIFRAQPRLWKGFAIIQSWGIVFEFGTLFILGFVSSSLTFYVFPLNPIWEWMDVIIGPTMLMAQKFILTALFQVANGVTSFEGTYGLAAIKKGWWLLRGRWRVALGLFAILIIPRIIADYLIVTAAATFPFPAAVEDASYMGSVSIEKLVRRLILVIPVIMMSLLVQITVMTWALFYISSKAYYHEGFSVHSDNYLSSDYELIASSKLVHDCASPV